MKLIRTQFIMPVLVLGASLLAASSARAKDVYLRAQAFDTILADGTAVHMWGFAEDTSAVTTNGVLTVPGPAITVDPSDPNLTIHLKNYLPEPVSIVIPNQAPALGSIGNPEKIDTDGTGRMRARSFTQEAAAVDNTTTPGTPIAGTAEYAWTNLQPGTYLYHSGSHPALQVQMGLYGALKKDAAAGQAYPGTNYDSEVTVLLSEIDLEVHQAVADDTYGTTIKSMIDSVPEYFLINGQPYTTTQTALLAGAVGQTTLVRFINACSSERVPVLNGYYLKLIAEDGRLYPYAKEQYAIHLPPLKTIDALLVPEAADTVMLYDRRLGLVNGSQPNGGMYQKLLIP